MISRCVMSLCHVVSSRRVRARTQQQPFIRGAPNLMLLCWLVHDYHRPDADSHFISRRSSHSGVLTRWPRIRLSVGLQLTV